MVTQAGKFAATAGDVVSINGHRVGDGPRTGRILEVLGEPGHERFRVLWEDERESVFYPGSDAIVRPQRKKEKKP